MQTCRFFFWQLKGVLPQNVVKGRKNDHRILSEIPCLWWLFKKLVKRDWLVSKLIIMFLRKYVLMIAGVISTKSLSCGKRRLHRRIRLNHFRFKDWDSKRNSKTILCLVLSYVSCSLHQSVHNKGPLNLQ